jgi:peptidoglycan hydrolase-like protein with peptidoglycan-binding domain
VKTYEQALAYAERQRTNPTQDWTRLCQKFARSCVGAAPFGTTALSAWYNTPAKHRHTSEPKPGSIAYFDDPRIAGEAGHAVWVPKTGMCYSNDILQRGKIDLVRLERITDDWGMRRLGWIDWTPSGPIDIVSNLPKVSYERIVAAAKADPSRPQAFKTYPAGVLLMEHGLDKMGLLRPSLADGHYGTVTKSAVRQLQRRRGDKTPSGIPTRAELKAIGLRGGFQVI